MGQYISIVDEYIKNLQFVGDLGSVAPGTGVTYNHHIMYNSHNYYSGPGYVYVIPHRKFNEHDLYNDHQLYVDIQFKPILYNQLDRTGWIYQPNTVRWRHRYNGVRESLKFNQEMGQFYCDVRILDLRNDSISRLLDILLNNMETGVIIQQLKFNWATDTQFADAELDIVGLDIFASVLEGFKHRVTVLENKRE